MSDLESCIDFLQRLIRTESLPGQEGDIAELVRAEMEQLGYSDAHLDEAGNVLGKVPGRGEAPAMMFHTHLDHVDVGEHDAHAFAGEPCRHGQPDPARGSGHDADAPRKILHHDLFQKMEVAMLGQIRGVKTRR